MYLFFVYIPFLWGERLYAITGVISLSVIPLKIVTNRQFSKGRLIDKIKDGNTIIMPVETTRAGEYEFDFSYKTAVPMTLKISGEGIEDTEVVLEASEELTNIDKLS